MPTSIPPQTDPEQPRPSSSPSADGAPGPGSAAPPAAPSAEPSAAPLTFVPHDATGAVSGEPVKVRSSRYGELDPHELVRLLDSIEDERARGRFRESIYISVFVYAIIAWLVIYGPRVLWHVPQLKMADVKSQELTSLTAPVLHAPVLKPPTMDSSTLARLREMSRRETPPAPAPAPPAPTTAPEPTPAPAPVVHATPQPAPPLPSAPEPVRRAPPVVAEAPTPQPSSRPSFNTGSGPESMQQMLRESARGGTGGGVIAAPVHGGGAAGAGSTIISDTEGVDFSDWKRRFDQGTIDAWIPLLPEEIQPPLMKKGETYILLTILPDGSIGHMSLEGSSRDEALDRAAWGSIVSQGRLPPLPKAFHGPNIVLRLHYMVNMQP